MIEKTIKTKNGNIITYRESSGNCIKSRIIQISYFEQENLTKTIILSMADDYGFEGYLEDASAQEIREANRVQFDFGEEDILYKHLETLLGQDNVLTIDDDETWEENKKTMQIFRGDKGIIVAFENKLQDNKISDKFRVFIKNILYDNRSKIDHLQHDTKERLARFFADVRNEFLQLDKEKEDEER